MATWLSKTAGAVAGKVGKAIDVAGRASGGTYYRAPFKLPELRISENLERIGGMLNPVKTASAYGGGGNPYAGTQQLLSNLYSNFPTVNNNPSAGVGGGGRVLGESSGQNYYDQGAGNVNQDVNNFGSVIDQDYENAVNVINQQEGVLRGQAETGTAQIQSEGAKAIQSVGAEEATRRTGLEGQQTTAEKTATSSTQQARDLFRQIQQQNIAQLSGLGISSSSVAEALAERLGVETARRIAGITGSLDEVRQNVSKELARVGDFYAAKKTEVQQAIQTQVQQLQTSLLQGLSQLSAARGQAASDKASRRAELLSNANNALLQLRVQQDQYQKSLDLWAQQKSEALNSATNFAVNAPDIQGFQNRLGNLVGGLQPATGFNYQPTFEVNPATGKMTSKIKYGQTDDEEDLSSPF